MLVLCVFLKLFIVLLRHYDTVLLRHCAGLTNTEASMHVCVYKCMRAPNHACAAGTVDSDDVLLGFLKPPGAGVNGVPLQTLFGFERVFVRAGATVQVHIYPELTQFTHVQANGTRVALPGEYQVSFGVKETLEHGMGFAEHAFAIA